MHPTLWKRLWNTEMFLPEILKCFCQSPRSPSWVSISGCTWILSNLCSVGAWTSMSPSVGIRTLPMIDGLQSPITMIAAWVVYQLEWRVAINFPISSKGLFSWILKWSTFGSIDWAARSAFLRYVWVLQLWKWIKAIRYQSRLEWSVHWIWALASHPLISVPLTFSAGSTLQFSFSSYLNPSSRLLHWDRLPIRRSIHSAVRSRPVPGEDLPSCSPHE